MFTESWLKLYLSFNIKLRLSSLRDSFIKNNYKCSYMNLDFGFEALKLLKWKIIVCVLSAYRLHKTVSFINGVSDFLSSLPPGCFLILIFLISMFVALTFLPLSSLAWLISSTESVLSLGPLSLGDTLTWSVGRLFEVCLSSPKIFKESVLFQSLIQMWPTAVPSDTTTACDHRYPIIHSSEVWEYGTKSHVPVVFSLGGHWSAFIVHKYCEACWILLLYLPFCWLFKDKLLLVNLSTLLLRTQHYLFPVKPKCLICRRAATLAVYPLKATSS